MAHKLWEGRLPMVLVQNLVGADTCLRLQVSLRLCSRLVGRLPVQAGLIRM